MAGSDLLLAGPVGDALGWARRRLPKSVGGGDVDAPPALKDTGQRTAPVARSREAKDPAQNFARGGPPLPRSGIQGSKLWRK